MKKKILVILISMLLITTVFSFTATADTCKRKPQPSNKKQNSPPDAPEVTIPEEVKRAKWLYIKTITNDPENDDIYYKYDIDGHNYGWVGPFKSGKEHIELIKLIIPVGSYTLGVQAKDVHGAESKWTYIDFNVVKTKSVISPLINLLKNHMNLFPIIRYILGV